jgi:hypothetical protein
MATPKKALAGIVTIPHEVALPMNIKFMYAQCTALRQDLKHQPEEAG